MRLPVLVLGLTLSLACAASGLQDYARQWTVLGDCAQAATPARTGTGAVAGKPLDCAGAFAVVLDESVYRQVTGRGLHDLAAFNAQGQALPFGPMPAAYRPPPTSWHDAAWFPLPRVESGGPVDLHLHATRSASGDLSLDATLRHGQEEAVRDVLIDVRAKDRRVEAIALQLILDAADFSAQVRVDASDDLQHWETIVPAASLAQLRQGGQMLVRRHIELPPRETSYLRLHVLGNSPGIPVDAVRLLLHPARDAVDAVKRSRVAADYVGREGRGYLFTLPGRMPVERVNVALADDNAIANFSVSVRDEGERSWTYLGQLTAFRLRGAGMALDNEAMDIALSRHRHWRIEPNIELSRPPTLELSYRPENWLLLTHGDPPFVVAAGSKAARRGQFPLDALVGQVRAKYGRQWEPGMVTLGPMRNAGGDAALSAYAPESRRTWLLWAVLVLAAGAIMIMVWRLLQEPRHP